MKCECHLRWKSHLQSHIKVIYCRKNHWTVSSLIGQFELCFSTKEPFSIQKWLTKGWDVVTSKCSISENWNQSILESTLCDTVYHFGMLRNQLCFLWEFLTWPIKLQHSSTKSSKIIYIVSQTSRLIKWIWASLIWNSEHLISKHMIPALFHQ